MSGQARTRARQNEGLPFGFLATLSPRADGALAEAKSIFGDGTALYVPATGLSPGELTLGAATSQAGRLRITEAASSGEEPRDYKIAARQISRSFSPSPKEFFRRTHVWNAPSNILRSKKVSWEGCWHWSRVLAFCLRQF
jgi:hypothetical protein